MGGNSRSFPVIPHSRVSKSLRTVLRKKKSRPSLLWQQKYLRPIFTRLLRGNCILSSESIQGQVILSTHSPYIAGMADIRNMRNLNRCREAVQVHQVGIFFVSDGNSIEQELLYSLDMREVFIQSLRDDGMDIDEFLDVDDEKTRRKRERVLQSYMNSFSRIKREMLSEDEVATEFSDKRLWHIFEYYQQALTGSGGMDFDDILIYAHRLLLDHEWIADIYRARYKHLCVDEAQDLNRIQYEFIKTLCGKSITSIMMVGDEQQMIYDFNSSSSRFLCSELIKDFSPLEYTLKENYRSTQAVIRVANRLSSSSKMVNEFTSFRCL